MVCEVVLKAPGAAVADAAVNDDEELMSDVVANSVDEDVWNGPVNEEVGKVADEITESGVLLEEGALERTRLVGLVDVAVADCTSAG